MQERALSQATFKREIPGLQQAGLYLNKTNLLTLEKNRAQDLMSLKASHARINLGNIFANKRGSAAYSRNGGAMSGYGS